MVQERPFLREDRRACVRLRTSHRPVSPWRRGHKAPLAQRQTVCRCCGCGDDYARAGSHHSDFYRLFGCRTSWRLRCSICDVLAMLCVRCDYCTLFQKYGKLPGVKVFLDGITTAAVCATTGAIHACQTLAAGHPQHFAGTGHRGSDLDIQEVTRASCRAGCRRLWTAGLSTDEVTTVTRRLNAITGVLARARRLTKGREGWHTLIKTWAPAAT